MALADMALNKGQGKQEVISCSSEEVEQWA